MQQLCFAHLYLYVTVARAVCIVPVTVGFNTHENVSLAPLHGMPRLHGEKKSMLCN